MAEFHFYGSNVDTFELLEAVTKPGDIELTPSNNYPTPRAKSYREVEDGLLEALAINPRLHVTGKFSIGPLRLRKIVGGDYDGTYVVNHRSDHMVDPVYGGPMFSISIPLCLKQGSDIWHLSPGDVFRQRQFYDEKTKQHYPPPDDFKAAYDDVVGRVKTVVKRRKVGENNLWIGSEAFELLTDGQAIILIRGDWVDANGKFIKSHLLRGVK